MSFLFRQLAAAAALLACAATTILVRLRRSRDRRLIRADLQSRRCQLISPRPQRAVFRCGRLYEVDFLDPEGDPAQAACTVARGLIQWHGDILEPAARAADLPTYGQNWRG